MDSGNRIRAGLGEAVLMTEEAIQRLAALKEDPSEYVRKSMGNALRDISKKSPDFIQKCFIFT